MEVERNSDHSCPPLLSTASADRNDLFVYTSKDLWAERQAWWLMELPDGVVDSYVVPKLRTLGDMEPDENSIDPCVLFELKASTASQNCITFSLTPQDLYLLKVEKYSSSLTLGLLSECPCFKLFSQFSSHETCLPEQGVLCSPKTDCILVGEKQAVVTCTPTYPRFGSVVSLYQSGLRGGSPCVCRSFEQLVNTVQASVEQLQLHLLLGYYACVPSSSRGQEMWVSLHLQWLVEMFSSFIYGLRRRCVSHTCIPWEEAYNAVVHTEKLPAALKDILRSSKGLAYQVLAFFCDEDKSGTDMDQLVQGFRDKDVDSVYTEYLTVIKAIDNEGSEQLSQRSFALNIDKVVRLYLRWEVAVKRQISPKDLFVAVITQLVNLFPPELLENESFLMNVPQHKVCRGDCPIATDERTWETLRSHCFGDLVSPDALFRFFAATDTLASKDDVRWLIQSPRIINPVHLCGFAVLADKLLLSLPHMMLPWDWKERVLALFATKAEWNLEELDMYLGPLAFFGKLSGYDVPSAETVAATYFLKAPKVDSRGNPVYLNRKLLLA